MSATVEKALRVLELLSTYSEPVRLTEFSRALSMNKSTTYRLLETMGQLGYVRQDEFSGRYMLSTRMWEIGVRAFQRFDIRTWARPYLQRIEQEVQETAVLAILDGSDVVILEKCDSSQAVQTLSPLGSRSPLHCSSLGKAFLMVDEDRLVRSLKTPLQSFTAETITTVRGLRKELAEARREGVTLAFDEFSIGVSGVSAPILGVDAQTLGVIGVTLPSIRAQGQHLDRAKRVVREQATDFSRAMGYLKKEAVEADATPRLSGASCSVSAFDGSDRA